MLRFVVLACLLSTACTGPLPPPAHPALSGADPAAMDRFLEQEVARRELPGLSVAVMREGRVVLRKGYGKRSLESGQPVDPDTLFGVGSITKQFTAACILLLAEDGKLSVEDRLSKYFPELTRAGEVTLLDLMSHTSGYPDYYPLDFLDGRLLRPIEPLQLAREYAGRGRVDFTPGTRWSYSNTGYVLLALVVEKVAGEPFGRFLERRVLQPLGMKHTRYEPAVDGPEYAQSYFSVVPGGRERSPVEARGWLGGAGALYSTATDLATWDLALMTGRVLRPESYRLLTTPRRLAGGAPTNYGCGLGVTNAHGELVLSHTGAVAGFAASNTMFPETRSAVVLLLNVSQYEALRELSRALVAVVAPRRDVPKVAGPGALEVAKRIFRGLQAGTLDRPRFGAAFNALLTEERLRRMAAALTPYGEPRSASLEESHERGGLEAVTILFSFDRGAFKATMYRSPDGMVQQFLLEKTGGS